LRISVPKEMRSASTAAWTPLLLLSWAAFWRRAWYSHLDGLEDEARVGRGVQRLEGLHGGEVTGVGDDLGVLAELLECVHIRRGSPAWEKGQGCPARLSGQRAFSGHLSLVSTGGLVQIAACASR